MDIQLEILQGIVSRAVELNDAVYDIVNLCSELDWYKFRLMEIYDSFLFSYIALAKTAKQFNLVRPELSTDSVLQIEDGRHLLVEMVCPNQFIPNDCNLSDQRMMIVTGANSSGKSIYLKQVGIIAYLAHVGR